MLATRVSAEEVMAIADDVYVFGYPMVLMDVTRRVLTAVSRPSEGKAPTNQFVHLRKFPDAAFTAVVSPNADTLYSTAWLNLTREPIILSVPSTGDRYYAMQMLDMWTNVFACPGTRASGNRQADFAITGPAWNGTLPSGVQRIQSPTGIALLGGRTLARGKEDYRSAHAIQDQYRLTPLSAWGMDYTSPDNVPVEKHVDSKTPLAEQVASMDAVLFFSRLNALMKDNPPAAGDEAAMRRFARIGVVPGETFIPPPLEIAGVTALKRGMLAGQARIAREAAKLLGKQINGWDVVYELGRYKTNYLFRAVIAMIGLGASLPEDALYSRATKDVEGRPLVGSNRYVIRFPKGQLPPVDAFWSITVYNSKQLFEPNSINRYAIGDRDKLKFEADGSLNLYVQNQSPGAGKEANWLPTPAGAFNLFMRLYSPGQDALDGVWKPPAIEAASVAAGVKSGLTFNGGISCVFSAAAKT